MLRTCTQCGVTKRVETGFHSKKHRVGQARCRSCVNQGAVRWMKNNPEKAKAMRQKSRAKRKQEASDGQETA